MQDLIAALSPLLLMIALDVIVRGLWSLRPPNEKPEGEDAKSEKESTETDNSVSGSDDRQGETTACDGEDKESSSEK